MFKDSIKISCMLVMLFSGSCLSAQSGAVVNSVSLQEFNAGLAQDKGEGHMLAFDEWRYGFYVDINGDTSEHLLFNYHTNSDKLFARKPQEGMVLNLNENLISLLILDKNEGEGQEKFELINWQSFEDFPDYSRFCVKLIDKPDFEIIKYYDKRLRVRQGRIDGYSEGAKPAYLSKPRYFWRKTNNDSFKEIELTRQNVQSILSKKQQEEIRGYIKANKLKWSREEDVLRMLASVF